MNTAIVVGSGPNGLPAAVKLARTGNLGRAVPDGVVRLGGGRATDLDVSSPPPEMCCVQRTVVDEFE